MAKTKVSEWDSTPGNNTDIDSINIAEGCAPSGINNAIRELMSQVKDFQQGTYSDPFNGPVNGTIGATTPAAGAFTTLAASGAVTLSGGTANGVPYLNGSKVLTTGSALQFDGTKAYNNLTAPPSGWSGIGTSWWVKQSATDGGFYAIASSSDAGIFMGHNGTIGKLGVSYGSTAGYTPLAFFTNDAEQMRLTSTGLGIGTSSPGYKLDVNGTLRNTGVAYLGTGSATNLAAIGDSATAGTRYVLFSRAAAVTDIVNIQGINAGSGAADLSLQSLGGNLGIGTSSPSVKLDVYGSDPRIQSYNSSGPKNIVLAGSTAGYTGMTTNHPLIFITNDTERMRLDSSGNLGLGVTPSAWSGYTAFQFGARGSLATTGSQSSFNQNAYYNGTSWLYLANSYASRYNQVSGQHEWYTAPSGTAGNAISFTQAMTLDASGNLGVGTTSPTAVGGYASVSTNGSTGSLFDSYAGGVLTGRVQASSNAYFISAQGASTTLAFGTANTERARIDSSGNLLVGTTSVISSNYRVNIQIPSTTGGIILKAFGSTASPLSFLNSAGTAVGGVDTTNTATTYNTSSDYRLKNTIAPMTGALAKVAQLKPVTYKWNADGSDGEGFIAHELAEVCPQAVTGEKDAVDADGNPIYQGIDTSFLAGLYAAALQELMAEVNSLKAEINTLKGI